jgi:hypothetical protein
MAEYQVGKKISKEDQKLIVKFLKTLTGTQHSAPQAPETNEVKKT